MGAKFGANFSVTTSDEFRQFARRAEQAPDETEHVAKSVRSARAKWAEIIAELNARNSPAR